MELVKQMRERIAKDQAVFGTFLSEFRASGAVTALKNGGLDFFMIDLEHGVYNPTDVAGLINDGKRMGMCPIVRIPLSSPGMYFWVLDAGAEGILIPQARTMDDVRQAVSLTKYPPMGLRGAHGNRPHANFMPPGDPRAYMDQANKQVATLIQIETAEAAELADEIAATEGVDGLYIGPSDLSISLGHAGNCDHEDMTEVMVDVGAACKKHGKIAGYHFRKPEHLPELMERGFRFLGYSCAMALFKQGVADLVGQIKAQQ